MAVSPNGESAYFVNVNSSSMAVINLKSHKVKEVHVALARGQLTDVALSPNGAQVYVTEIFPECPCKRSLIVVNAATDQVSTPLPIGGSSDAVAVSPNGRYLFVSEVNQTLKVVDIAMRRVVATIPLGSQYIGTAYITVSPNGEIVYVVSNSGATGSQNVDSFLDVVSVPAKKVIRVIDQGQFAPCGLAAAPNGKVVYESSCSTVGNAPISSEDFRVLSTSTNTISSRIAIANFSSGIVFSPDGGYAYVGEGGANGFSVINTSTNRLVTQVSIPASSTIATIDQLAINSNGRVLYATSFSAVSPTGFLDVIPLSSIAPR